MPDIYSQDLHAVDCATRTFEDFLAKTESLIGKEHYILTVNIALENAAGYSVGQIVYEDEQIRFVPHSDAAAQ